MKADLRLCWSHLHISHCWKFHITDHIIIFQYDPTESDVAKLQQLFKVAKAVMKYRNDDVEQFMAEMEKDAKRTKKKGLSLSLC